MNPTMTDVAAVAGVSLKTVSPFVRRAIRKAAVSGSEALPSITSRSTVAASSAERS